jgi:hypothetical protein
MQRTFKRRQTKMDVITARVAIWGTSVGDPFTESP